MRRQHQRCLLSCRPCITTLVYNMPHTPRRGAGAGSNLRRDSPPPPAPHAAPSAPGTIGYGDLQSWRLPASGAVDTHSAAAGALQGAPSAFKPKRDVSSTGASQADGCIDIKTDANGPDSPWHPYEAAYTENAVVMPWLPRRFYHWRWALMRRNPLCRRAPAWLAGGRATFGELLLLLLIVGQMAALTVYWAASRAQSRDPRLTGALYPASG